jgi:hypothetical protein
MSEQAQALSESPDPPLQAALKLAVKVLEAYEALVETQKAVILKIGDPSKIAAVQKMLGKTRREIAAKSVRNSRRVNAALASGHAYLEPFHSYVVKLAAEIGA